MPVAGDGRGGLVRFQAGLIPAHPIMPERQSVEDRRKREQRDMIQCRGEIAASQRHPGQSPMSGEMKPLVIMASAVSPTEMTPRLDQIPRRIG